jgi:hypothetical protein
MAGGRVECAHFVDYLAAQFNTFSFPPLLRTCFAFAQVQAPSCSFCLVRAEGRSGVGVRYEKAGEQRRSSHTAGESQAENSETTHQRFHQSEHLVLSCLVLGLGMDADGCRLNDNRYLIRPRDYNYDVNEALVLFAWLLLLLLLLLQ